MYRYSYSISFVPLAQQQGGYMFYLTRNRWDGNRCIDSKTIVERRVTQVAEIQHDEQFLANSIQMADLAYQLIAEEYAKRNRPSNGEINGRPGDTSVPS